MRDIGEQMNMDIAQAKDAEQYKQMVLLMSRAENKSQLEQAALLFAFDVSYARSDICLALHTIECARGWH